MLYSCLSLSGTFIYSAPEQQPASPKLSELAQGRLILEFGTSPPDSKFLPIKPNHHLQNLNAIREESDLFTMEQKLTECNESITELFNTLMILEMQLVEQLEVEPDWPLSRASACNCRVLQACPPWAPLPCVQRDPVDAQERTGQGEAGGSPALTG